MYKEKTWWNNSHDFTRNTFSTFWFFFKSKQNVLFKKRTHIKLDLHRGTKKRRKVYTVCVRTWGPRCVSLCTLDLHTHNVRWNIYEYVGRRVAQTRNSRDPTIVTTFHGSFISFFSWWQPTPWLSLTRLNKKRRWPITSHCSKGWEKELAI